MHLALATQNLTDFDSLEIKVINPWDTPDGADHSDTDPTVDVEERPRPPA